MMANQLFLRPVVLTAIKVALVVGTVLALINHGPALLALELSRQQILQIALTYLVPYGVSTYSSVKMLKNQSVSPHNPQA
ncbi:MAG: nitrate/nitrite transporter NrtS [Pseudomonadales bacterium]|nr:nitrate/nitrite transporter NrtS [Pseudomonadales bacterium]